MAEATINNPHLPQNPTKFYTHFLYKAIFISIFLLILPLFPSQAPEFINNKTLTPTSWEFLQLIFVGIAVSYGLFSKRNDEPHKEEPSFKSDNPQSYVARLLQGSSVFDDDSETPSGGNDRVHTWNSQYYRGEPIVVVAKESDDAATVEKPLVLPVRSLKSGGSEAPATDSPASSYARSNWRRVSRNLNKLKQEESEENIVLRSPIPWRSRSGRMMEVKEEFSQTPSVHDSSEINPIDSPSFRYQSSKSSPLSEAQTFGDVGRRKITHKSSSFSQTPPPPPPPPPPPVNINHTHIRTNPYAGRELKRNVRSVPEELQTRGRRSSEFTIRTRSDASESRSFRTRKDSELDANLSHDREIERFIERIGSQREMEYPKEEKKESPEDSDSGESSGEVEEEEGGGGGGGGGGVMSGDTVGVDGGDNGPDVDKKADEFIAKFREQIRLQRIASIRKSTAQN